MLVLVSSCGGESNGMSARRDALSNTSNGNHDWALTEMIVGPGDLVFPMDCLGEDFTFVGTVRFNDHLTPGPRGIHDNWIGWYDPEEFSSVDTGQTWVFLPGANNTGVAFIDESGVATVQESHVHIPLQNTTTGQKIHFHLDVHISINAAGEVKHDFLAFGCAHGP
jgi:hypothetical protein